MEHGNWWRRGAVALTVAATGLAGVSAMTPAGATFVQDRVVSERPDTTKPQLVAYGDVAQPRVNAIAEVNGTMFAGGLFRAVEQGGTTTERQSLVAFDKATGELSPTFAADVTGGQIWSVTSDPATNSLYVAGDFKTVNGVARAALAKLDATTGAVDPAFKPPFGGGLVNDVQVVENAGSKHLVFGGTPARKLMSLNPSTGRDDGWLDLAFSDPLSGSTGIVAINRFDITADGTRLVATGNFTRVDGLSRSRLVVADLSVDDSTVSPWYYRGFEKYCASATKSKIDYLEGVDWSPDGRSFSVAATGYVTRSRFDIWYQRLGDANVANTAVCDAVGRFDMDDSQRPAWINYTGGDTVWEVSDTGAAVYAAGHFRWFDNPDGNDSVGVGDRTSGRPAVRRQGIGAIDSATGLALEWNPPLTATRLGGRALLSDSTGLWIGNDATKLSGVPRRGLQFLPLS